MKKQFKNIVQTDVLYVLGTGSSWNNNEIRFSLRSIEKYGLNVGKIFIAGELPDFLSDQVIHIPCPDIYIPSVNADGNIAHKVITACADSRLSENFLFINDDHILLKTIDLKQFPAFHKGDMNTFPESYWSQNYWRSRLKATRDTLNRKGLTAFHFDCHAPIILNKSRFPEVISQFKIGDGIGLTMKSLYGNSVYCTSSSVLTTEKKTIFTHYTGEQIDMLLQDCSFTSFNDAGLNFPLKKWLYERFPDPGPLEISDINDRQIEILKWINSAQDYNDGRMIFEKYFKNHNLIKLFNSGDNENLRKKLAYKLIHSLPE